MKRKVEKREWDEGEKVDDGWELTGWGIRREKRVDEMEMRWDGMGGEELEGGKMGGKGEGDGWKGTDGTGEMEMRKTEGREDEKAKGKGLLKKWDA